MDYTTIQSNFFGLLNSTGELLFIAAAGLCSVFAAQIIRLYLARFRADRRFNAYKHRVIAPFVTDENVKRSEAMVPYFARRGQ